MTVAFPSEFTVGMDELVELVANYVAVRERVVGPCKRVVTLTTTRAPSGDVVTTATVRFEAMTAEELAAEGLVQQSRAAREGGG